MSLSTVQLTLAISTSVISNNCLSRSEILVPVLTSGKNIKDIRGEIALREQFLPLFHNSFNIYILVVGRLIELVDHYSLRAIRVDHW